MNSDRPHPFSASQPWDWVIRESVDRGEFTFWFQEFESRAMLIKNKIESETEALGPEVTALLPQRRGALPDRSRSPRGARPGDRRPTDDRRVQVDARGSDGRFTTNRKGVPLCKDYCAGNCPATVTVASAPRCSRNHSLAHQCDLCLGTHVPGSQACRGKGKGNGNKGKGRGNVRRR